MLRFLLILLSISLSLNCSFGADIKKRIDREKPRKDRKSLGDVVGNGGDLAFCGKKIANTDKAQPPEGVYFLDYVMEFANYNFLNLPTLTAYTKYFESILAPTPLLLADFQAFMKEYLQAKEGRKVSLTERIMQGNSSEKIIYKWHINEFEFPDIVDEDLLKELPPNCRSKNQARHSKKIQGVRQFIIRKKVNNLIQFEAITSLLEEITPKPLQESLAVMHEWAREFTTDTTYQLRDLNATLHSVEAHKFFKKQELTLMDVWRSLELVLPANVQGRINKENSKLINFECNATCTMKYKAIEPYIKAYDQPFTVTDWVSAVNLSQAKIEVKEALTNQCQDNYCGQRPKETESCKIGEIICD